MKPHELKAARLAKGLGQTKVAATLGVSQAYVNMLEKGKRRLTPELTRRLAAVYELSPEALPLSEQFRPKPTGDEYLAQALGKLGYPGFAYLHSHVVKKNPGEVLLIALGQEALEARVAEALPWVAMQYAQVESNWLVEQARKFNLQNRLGFVVDLALRVAAAKPQNDNPKFVLLRQLRAKLDESRLAKEDVFYRPPRTESEKEWMLQNRTEDAKHWNLLADLRPEHLQYAS